MLCILGEKPDDDTIGQNIAIIANSNKPLEEAVAEWYSEGLGYDYVMSSIEEDTSKEINLIRFFL